MDAIINLIDLLLTLLSNRGETDPHTKAIELIQARKAAKAIDAEIDAKFKHGVPKV